MMMIEFQTPPLPLPLKGGECLTESLLRMTAQPIPSLQGEGQGWGLYLNHAKL